MQTAITSFLTAVGFGTVCIGTIVCFAYLTAVFDVWLTGMKIKKMENKNK